MRHSKVITLRRPDMLERSRAEALNPDVVNKYFSLLGETLGKLGLKINLARSSTATKPSSHWTATKRKL